MNCVICESPLPKTKGKQATTCPGPCRHERNKRLWRENGERRRKEFHRDDGLAEAREWLRRNAGAVPRRGSDVGTSPLLGRKSEE
jgi:hypothetical protein